MRGPCFIKVLHFETLSDTSKKKFQEKHVGYIEKQALVQTTVNLQHSQTSPLAVSLHGIFYAYIVSIPRKLPNKFLLLAAAIPLSEDHILILGGLPNLYILDLINLLYFYQTSQEYT